MPHVYGSMAINKVGSNTIKIIQISEEEFIVDRYIVGVQIKKDDTTNAYKIIFSMINGKEYATDPIFPSLKDVYTWIRLDLFRDAKIIPLIL